MNILVVVATSAHAPAARAVWVPRLGERDRLFVLALTGPSRVGEDVHPFDVDPDAGAATRGLAAVARRWPALAAAAWPWFLEDLWAAFLWHVRSFDADLVDLRAAPARQRLRERLARELPHVAVLVDRKDSVGIDPSWRRNDPAALVSIVLPVYQGARYLERAIASCLGQSHRRLELVIVDDASTDGTAEIIVAAARADARVVPVRNERNLRLPGALNVGFARARGAYLTWTSHDNYYAPDAIATLVRYLATWPDVDFVYSAYRVIDEEDRVSPEIWYRPPPWQLRRSNPVGPYFLYRRAVYEATGDFRRDMEYLEDYEYWVRVAKRFTLMRLPLPLYQYRQHADSMSRRAPAVDRLRRQLQAEHFGAGARPPAGRRGPQRRGRGTEPSWPASTTES